MSRPTSQTLESAHAFATGAGYVRAITVTLKESVTAMRYIWVFDNPSAASGTKLDVPTPVAPGERFVLDYEPTLLPFTTGLYVALSTSAASFVAPVATDEAWFGADIAPAAIVLGASQRMGG